MKTSRLLTVAVTLLTILVPLRINAEVTKNELTDYVESGQAILPNSNWVIIIGLNMVSAPQDPLEGLPPRPQQRLESVLLQRNSVPGFPLLDIAESAVMTRGGVILGSTPGVGLITIPGGVAIPSNDEGVNAGDDFFIAIRTTDNTRDRDRATFGVPAGGVNYSGYFNNDGEWTTGDNNAALTTGTIICQLRIGDVMPLEFDDIHSDWADWGYPEYQVVHPGQNIRPRYENNSYDSYYFYRRVPQVLQWEQQTAVLGISCAHRNVRPSGTATPDIQDPPEQLNSVTITVTDLSGGNFDPNQSFRISPPVEPGEPDYGITLWRADGAGNWTPGNTQLEVTYSGGGAFTPVGPGEWTLTLFPGTDVIGHSGDPIPAMYDGIYQYFIVIEQRADNPDAAYRPRMGQDFKIWIQPGGVNFAFSNPQSDAGIPFHVVKAIYNNLYMENIAQSRVDPVHIEDEPDQTYNVTPVIGINLASGPGLDATRISQIRVELLAHNNFNPAVDLAPRNAGDARASGITLWRDNKEAGIVGAFDRQDTIIATQATAWIDEGQLFDEQYGDNVRRFTTTLTVHHAAEDRGLIPPDDFHQLYQNNLFGGQYRGHDFFLAVRTSQSLSYGAEFSVKIPSGGLQTTAGPNMKQARNVTHMLSSEILGNVYAGIEPLFDPENPGLVPFSPPKALFKVSLNDNASGLLPLLEGITVEFYDIGNFHYKEDLAPFTPITPVLDDEGWYYVFNPGDASALKECGVVIYRDSALTDPVLIRRFRDSPKGWPRSPSGYQFEFAEPERLPSTLYVAIRTSGTFTPGDSFDAGIVGWGLGDWSWERWGSRALPIIDIDEVRSTIYARKHTGTFNPGFTGEITLRSRAEYNSIVLEWDAAPIASFERYEIYRSPLHEGQENPVHWTEDRLDTEFIDDRSGLEEGVEYTYELRTVYNHEGALSYSSSILGSKLLGFTNNQLPNNLTYVVGENTVTIMWTDRSYNPNAGIDQRERDRAHLFVIERTYRLDDSVTVIEVESKHTEQNPFDREYEYIDEGLAAGTYDYTFYLRRVLSGDLTSESAELHRLGITVFDEQKGGFNEMGSGCFIATAAYGTDMAEEVEVLRRFRDSHLIATRAGRAFVRWYYRHSPPVADFIRGKEALRSAVRAGLRPLVWGAGLFQRGQ